MPFDVEIRDALIEQVRRFVTEKCVPAEAGTLRGVLPTRRPSRKSVAAGLLTTAIVPRPVSAGGRGRML